MADQTEFSNKVQSLAVAKQDWYNNTELPKLLEQYRLLHTCIKNIYELLVKKSLIVQDPYRLDKKISDIEAPESTAFADSDRSLIIGKRLSDYETMLDFLCTYVRFNVENLPLQKIKKLNDLNNTFFWNELSTNSSKPNTKAIADLVNEARLNATQLIISTLNDSTSKSGQALTEINSILSKFTQFQRELYKVSIRKDLLEHPNFNKEKAYSSAEAELAEIKRLYPDIMGKKPFYTELITEIISEDQGSDKERLQAAVIDKLQIVEAVAKKKTKKVDPKEFLLSSLLALGALAPTYQAIAAKIVENFGLLKEKKKSFFSKLADAFKKAFKVQEKEIEFTINYTDPATKTKASKRIAKNALLQDIQKKQKIYTDIATKSGDYGKIIAASEQAIFDYVGKQITENQRMFSVFMALDEHFKSSAPVVNKPKIKGMKIELDTMKNTIISVNKKRGEYQSIVEEAEQMKKLGIAND